MEHGSTLPLDRCPHCNVAKPHLSSVYGFHSHDDRGVTVRKWGNYQCSVCGGVLLAVAPTAPDHRGNREALDIVEIWPAPQQVDAAVPGRAREYLRQAISSIHAPAGAVILAASAIDAMLKDKGLTEGNLYRRIQIAAETHLITSEMAEWAHEVRLDANDQRHADEMAELPDSSDAKKSIEFSLALAQFLFVLPARVAAGRAR